MYEFVGLYVEWFVIYQKVDELIVLYVDDGLVGIWIVVVFFGVWYWMFFEYFVQVVVGDVVGFFFVEVVVLFDVVV